MRSRDLNDLTFVEPRRDVRAIVSIPGTLLLAGRHNAHGDRRAVGCRAVNISARAIAIACAVDVKLGERAILRLDQFGEFRGLVIRLLKGGFVLDIMLSGAQREALEAKIEGFEKIKNHDLPDRRRNARFVPKDPRSRLIWANGRTESCLILDLSVCGAAVSAETVPKVGTVIALGSVIGRVIRRSRGGFAMQFIEQQSSDSVEALATAK
jgi:hypothetical protein